MQTNYCEANHGQVMSFLGSGHGETRGFLRDLVEGVSRGNFLLQLLVENLAREVSFRAYEGYEEEPPLSDWMESKNPKEDSYHDLTYNLEGYSDLVSC